MSADRESIGAFLQSHAPALAMRLAEHVQLSALAIVLAFVLGVALALATYRRRALWVPLLAVTGMLQTVPGIALLVIMMALLGRIGSVPALAALVVYALLPIVQNSLVGLQALPPSLAEAARGLGLTRWQRLRHVRLPLALPLIIAGLRTAAVQTVGLATLAAFVGAGGLGQFINRGLFLSDNRLILLGAVPAALLALLIHFLIGLLAVAVAATQPAAARRRASFALAAFLIGAIAFILFVMPHGTKDRATITIGSKNFTEQLIVAEMVAQQIERRTPLKVTRRFGLGGSTVMHQALVDGSIDLGIEYSGTAWSAILHRPPLADPNAVFPEVRKEYRKKYGLVWLPPLGFNNSYQLAVRSDDARLAGVKTISGLVGEAPRLTAAFDFEFAERADGYAGLKRTYGLAFNKVLDMHPDLLYGALGAHHADIISAYATDGRLHQAGLRTLIDDRHFFPPYEAAVVIRASVLQNYPQLTPALRELSGKLDNARMAELNAAVDAKRLSVEQAASEALN